MNSASNRNYTRRQPTSRDLARPEPPPPPPPDESYWAALLQEGEQLSSASMRHTREWAQGFDSPLAESGERTDNQSRADWQAIEQIYRADQVVTLPVIGYNRGGLLVEWRSLRGFVPASQLVDFPATADGALRRNELALRVGQTLRLRVIELDYEQNRLILSERAAQVQAGTRANILDSLQRGAICEGQVTNLCDFGAFIDLGGVEGLIHISELSWGRVSHPRDILARGQKVKVYVMDVQREQGRIALSLKRLQPDPWATVAQRYQVGQIVEGVITNVVDFGAFARVEEGLEGLIHVSELAEGNFLHPRNVVREGERVRARVLNIDGNSRRLGLSLRRLNGDLDVLRELPAQQSGLIEH